MLESLTRWLKDPVTQELLSLLGALVVLDSLVTAHRRINRLDFQQGVFQRRIDDLLDDQDKLAITIRHMQDDHTGGVKADA